MRKRLIELIGSKVCGDYSPTCDEWNPHSCEKCYANDCKIGELADHLLDNGVVVPPCKVGDIVWDTEGNAWKIFAITIWEDCIGLKTANSKDIRKTFTIGKRSISKTVFLTREEAEQKLKEGKG